MDNLSPAQRDFFAWLSSDQRDRLPVPELARRVAWWGDLTDQVERAEALNSIVESMVEVCLRHGTPSAAIVYQEW